MSDSAANKKLFWACFIALVATSFVFGVRATVIGTIGKEFDLSQSEIGLILGAGMWPFAISIILFSLIIDKIGYKTSAFCAIACHIGAIIWTLTAQDKTALLLSTLLVAFGNGIVEAFINPVVATAYPKEKAKWLNILHAGWPLGLALGALFTLGLGAADMSWKWQFGACLIPVAIYAVLVFPCKFPPNERVAAGVSYRDMLSEVGAIGFFIIGGLLSMGVVQICVALEVFKVTDTESLTIGAISGAVIAVAAGIYTRSLGNWMFILILLTMPFLATTELGTDGWMQELLKADLSATAAAWIFIGISIIMTILRCYAGPIVHRFSPIGLLVLSAALAIVGLILLGVSPVSLLVVAALVYAFGKTFVWSTTLGLVSEQFPKGGALTLNGVSAVGVLGLGIIGSVWMGAMLDRGIDADLKEHAAIHEKVKGEDRPSILGAIPSIDEKAVEQLPEEDQKTVQSIQKKNKKGAFIRQAILPAIMLVCYLILFFYFKSRGGYKPKEIGAGGH